VVYVKQWYIHPHRYDDCGGDLKFKITLYENFDTSERKRLYELVRCILFRIWRADDKDDILKTGAKQENVVTKI